MLIASKVFPSGRRSIQLGREQASYSSSPMLVALFLLPPSEPDVHLFSASGSPVPLIRFRKLTLTNECLNCFGCSHLACLSFQTLDGTCRPSPCKRFSRSRT